MAELTQAERVALAVIRVGLSFDDAAKQSRLPVQEVIALWERESKPCR